MFFHDDDLPDSGDDPNSEWFGEPWFLALAAAVLVATCFGSTHFPLPWFGG